MEGGLIIGLSYNGGCPHVTPLTTACFDFRLLCGVDDVGTATVHASLPPQLSSPPLLQEEASRTAASFPPPHPPPSLCLHEHLCLSLLLPSPPLPEEPVGEEQGESQGCTCHIVRLLTRAREGCRGWKQRDEVAKVRATTNRQSTSHHSPPLTTPTTLLSQ